MNVTPHPTHPDTLRLELREREQIAFFFGAAFRYSAAPPESRASIDRGAAAAGLPVAVYAPIFARFMQDISSARAAAIRDQLRRLTSEIPPAGE